MYWWLLRNSDGMRDRAQPGHAGKAAQVLGGSSASTQVPCETSTGWEEVAVTSRPFLQELAKVVGSRNVLTDLDMVAGHARDWTGRFVGHTPAVVRPGSTDEVAAVIAVCRSAGVAIVPQGGNTGLVGGGVPLYGEVVVNLRRLAEVPEVEADLGLARVSAGVTVAVLQDAAARAGLMYGVDLSSRGSATIGGTIATNAAGLKAVRFGDTRAQIIGVEAVLGDGSIVSHLGGLARDNTGYHLPSLLAGSEGTLGIITRAVLRLRATPKRRAVALIGLNTVADAVQGAIALRRELVGLEAIEFILRSGMNLVREAATLRAPLDKPCDAYLLVEVTGDEPLGPLTEAVGSLSGLSDAAIAEDPRTRASLWEYRDRHTEAINTLGTPVKLDVTIPLAALADFLIDVPDLVSGAASNARTWLFGHVGDGIVHVNISGAGNYEDEVENAVLNAVVALKGSISSEHGVGTTKRRWLHLVRSQAELAAFQRIKGALDPDGILNPHILLP
jgi:FAD/FMN-containing dehydrogenase